MSVKGDDCSNDDDGLVMVMMTMIVIEWHYAADRNSMSLLTIIMHYYSDSLHELIRSTDHLDVFFMICSDAVLSIASCQFSAGGIDHSLKHFLSLILSSYSRSNK